MGTAIQIGILFMSCVTTFVIFEDFMSLNFEKKQKGSYLLYFVCK